LSEAEISQVDHFKPIAGKEKKVKVDLVVLGMGFTGPEADVFDAFWITANNSKLTNNDTQIYVDGECRRRPSLVRWG
ncbi:glutamate synthase subunit beta, partial [Lacticaseibacillus rhamnosus]